MDTITIKNIPKIFLILAIIFILLTIWTFVFAEDIETNESAQFQYATNTEQITEDGILKSGTTTEQIEEEKPIQSATIAEQVVVENSKENESSKQTKIKDKKERPKPYKMGELLIKYDERVFGEHLTKIKKDGITGKSELDTKMPVGIADRFFRNNNMQNPIVKSRINSMNVELIEIDEKSDPLNIIKQLRNDRPEGIVFAQPNFIYKSLNATSNYDDPLGNYSWHLKAIQIQDAWNAVSSSTPSNIATVTVGVIDDGVDFSSADLDDRKWSVMSCVDENNDTVNDCTKGGYDVFGVEILGVGFHDEDPVPEGGDAHGTYVSSVVAGEADNNYGVIGVAQEGVEIVGIRVGNSIDLPLIDPLEIFTSADIIQGIDFARYNEIDIINLSLGGYIDVVEGVSLDGTTVSSCNDFKYVGVTFKKEGRWLMYEALEDYGATTSSWGGGLVVTSAGNDDSQTGGGNEGDTIHFPSDFASTVSVHGNECWTGLDNVISVGGTQLNTQEEMEMTWLSDVTSIDSHPDDFNDNGFVGTSWGNHISVAAPALWIPVSSSTGAALSAGTSFAAPQVAGVAALMLRVNPDLTPAEIKEKIMDSADIVPDLYDANVAEGRRLNAYLAVKAALGSTTAELDAIRLDPLPEIEWGVNPLTTSTASTSTIPKGGTDSDDDGLIEIASLRQLNNIRYDLEGTSYKTYAGDIRPTDGCPSAGCTGYELVRDIDFLLPNGSSTIFSYGKGWTPIGQSSSFTATFNGNGHTISNLTINSTTTDYVGLFGRTDNHATIKNLTLENATITGEDYVGGLIGYANNTTIDQVGVDAQVDGKQYVGGMVGRLNGGVTIKDSYISGAVDPNNNASRVGGLIGYTYDRYNRNYITDTYGLATVRNGFGYDWYGDRYRHYTPTITNSYYLSSSAASSRHSNGRRTTTELKTSSATTSTSTTATFSNWSTSTWTFPTDEYPHPTNLTSLASLSNHPQDTDGDGLLNISTTTELQNINNQLQTECPNSTRCLGFELDNDIDLTDITWTPIGQSSSFTAIFNGNGHTISNLTINSTTTDYVGLFGRTDNHATIKNLTLENATITGEDYVGGLIGYANNTTIDQVGVDAQVDGKQYVGGMVGRLNGGVTIKDSYISGAVDPNNNASRVGGLIGYTYDRYNRNYITDTYGLATVRNGFGYDWYGDRYRHYTPTITNSYYSSDETGSSRHSSGLRTNTELKEGVPTSATATDAIYVDWDEGVWDFGSTTTYPIFD